MDYYTVKETSRVLGVSERWLQMLCKQGRIIGATRVNSKGTWQIPINWVNSRKNELSMDVKGFDSMKKIVMVVDELSTEAGDRLFLALKERGIEIYKKGIIPMYSHASEEEIIDRLYEIVSESSIVLGVSVTGNGIAIFLNKIKGFTVAPIGSYDDAIFAVDTYEANGFDIPADNNGIVDVYLRLIERIG